MVTRVSPNGGPFDDEWFALSSLRKSNGEHIGGASGEATTWGVADRRGGGDGESATASPSGSLLEVLERLCIVASLESENVPPEWVESRGDGFDGCELSSEDDEELEEVLDELEDVQVHDLDRVRVVSVSLGREGVPTSSLVLLSLFS